MTLAASLGGCVSTAIGVLHEQHAQAATAAMHNDLGLDKIAVIEYATDHDGALTGVTPAALAKYGFSQAKSTLDLQVHVGSDLKFCIQARTQGGPVEKDTADGDIAAGHCVAGADY